MTRVQTKDIQKFRQLLSEMTLDKLKYVKLSTKIKLFIIKIVFSNDILLKSKCHLRIRIRYAAVKKMILRK